MRRNLLVTLTALNSLDAFLTLWWVTHNLAAEDNPLMNWLLRLHPMAFLGTKLIVVNALALLVALYFDRCGRWVRTALVLLVGAYMLAMIRHAGLI